MQSDGCLALWMSYCGRSLCDKIVAMILPITLFVASGFEHCIANLFVIPFAIAIRHFAPTSFWQLAHSSADHFPVLTVSHFITANLLPVMLGNIIGGAVLVSICYRAIYLRQEP
ncbi:formate transporter FocB [Escherichia coli]|uniref:Formate transporter FocB n=1 Tax=Escherichia coli TaxID=562 RepID=A0A485JET9_ECOLX|nr:formate transporter FocB [Escherichia coli]